MACGVLRSAGFLPGEGPLLDRASNWGHDTPLPRKREMARVDTSPERHHRTSIDLVRLKKGITRVLVRLKTVRSCTAWNVTAEKPRAKMSGAFSLLRV